MRAGRQGAFTLVEVMVATAVLVVLMMFVTQALTLTTRSTRASTQSGDSAAQARLVFDRLQTDLAAMVVRQDVAVLMRGSDTTGIDGNNPATRLADIPNDDSAADFLRFVSALRAPDSPAAPASRKRLNRGISVVAYRMGVPDRTASGIEEAGKPALLRGQAPVYWTGADSAGFFGLQRYQAAPIDPVVWVPVPLWNLSFAQSPATPNGQYDVLAPAVIKMELAFVLRPWSEAVTLADGTVLPASSVAPLGGEIVPSPPVRVNGGLRYLDIRPIAALVVTLAMVDLENRKLATRSQLEAMANDLSYNPAAPWVTTAADAWLPLAENPTTLSGTAPLPVKAALRIHQRTFALPVP